MSQLTPAEAAEYCRVSVRTLAEYRMNGSGPRYAKFSKRVLYQVRDLDAWIEKHKRATSDAKPGKKQPKEV
jgi:hypothetical protein